jgi:hypothetical protein
MRRFHALLLSCSDEEAIANLRALRDEHQGYMRADLALRVQAIRMEASNMREVIHYIRAEAMMMMPLVNPVAIISERITPLRHWRSSNYDDDFRSFQRTVCESYPNHFDWKSHLDALDAALSFDEASALSALYTAARA